jgi:hypothetical protein
VANKDLRDWIGAVEAAVTAVRGTRFFACPSNGAAFKILA